MAVNTYYFDASDNGPTDLDGVWTNDANAFDGSTSTAATTGASSGDGGTTNGLRGGGTNAPSSGGAISQVRARIYGRSQGLTLTAGVYTDGLGELLGSPDRSGAADWGAYVVLSAPTGGWTWAKVQALETLIYDTQPGASTEAYRAEVEVTSEDVTTTSTSSTSLSISTSTSISTSSTSISISVSTSSTSTSISSSTSTSSTSASTSSTSTSTTTVLSIERLWSSGFELNTTASNVEWSSFTGSPSIQSTIVRSGNYALRCNTSSSTQFGEYIFTSPVSEDAFYLRFYLYVASAPSSATNLVIWRQGTTSSGVRLSIGTDLRLSLGDATPTGHGTSAGGAIVTGQWYRVEMMQQDSTSTIEARLDGVTFGSSSSANVLTTDRIRVGVQNSVTTDLYIDDVAIQTSWPGEGKIVHLHPNADGDAAEGSRGGADTGSDWGQVAETTPNDATDYWALEAAQDDLLVNIDSSGSVGIGGSDSVTLVQVGARFAAASAGFNTNIITMIRSQSGGTTTLGSTATTGTTTWNTNNTSAPRNYLLTSYTDPQAGGAWTPALLDSTQIGARTTDGSPDTWVSTLWALVEYREAAPTTSTSSTSSSISTSLSTSTSTSTTSTSTSISTSISISTSSTSSSISISISTSSTSSSMSTSISTSSTSTSISVSTSSTSVSISVSTSSTSSSTSTTISTTTSTSSTSSSTSQSTSISTSTSSTSVSFSTSSTSTSVSTSTTLIAVDIRPTPVLRIRR